MDDLKRNHSFRIGIAPIGGVILAQKSRSLRMPRRRHGRRRSRHDDLHLIVQRALA